MLDKGVIVAQGPAQVTEQPGVWVLAGKQGGFAEELAVEMAARNQTVVLVGNEDTQSGVSVAAGEGVVSAAVDAQSREAWQALIEGLPEDAPFKGVVHLGALQGHGAKATTSGNC